MEVVAVSDKPMGLVSDIVLEMEHIDRICPMHPTLARRCYYPGSRKAKSARRRLRHFGLRPMSVELVELATGKKAYRYFGMAFRRDWP